MNPEATRAAEALGLSATRRHIFLCVKSTEQTCCGGELAAKSWEHLKIRLKQLGLSEKGGIQRTKADCLRICAEGPVLLIWPEGIVYGGVTAERIERIVHEHVIGGHPIEPWIVQRLPFQGFSAPPAP